MDTNPLQPIIRKFLGVQNDDPVIQSTLENHNRRKARAAKLLQLDQIPILTREQLEEFLRDTDAWFGLRWNKQEYLSRVFGKEDELLPQLRETLADLIRRADAGLTPGDFNQILERLPGIGPAFLSEMLGLRFPDKYWLFNKQIEDFLSPLGIDLKSELPRGKKSDPGEKYFVAGHHLADLRRALSDEAKRPVDQLFTDQFIYWVNQQETPDPLADKIARLLRELMPPQRVEARLNAEAQARSILEAKHGVFEAADLAQLLSCLNVDWWEGKSRQSRFLPAFGMPSANLIQQGLGTFNAWLRRFWEAGDDEIDALLEEIWKSQEVVGLGTSLPTAILYLKDPKKYNIWLPVMAEGLSVATGSLVPKVRSAGEYRRYNSAVIGFRDRYRISPQALDMVLWKIAQEDNGGTANGFAGFTPETFKFLSELSANNSFEWMRRDNKANELRYRRVLREPLRALFEALAPSTAALNPVFETEVKSPKVMASIMKRQPDEEGPYHTYLWGAFYRKHLSKQKDSQLFVAVHPDRIEAGFCVAGARGVDTVTRFRKNLRHSPGVFLSLLADLPSGVRIAVAPKHGSKDRQVVSVSGIQDLEALMQHNLIDIEKVFQQDSETVYKPALAEEVRELFRALYPLFRFASIEDTGELQDLVEGPGPDDMPRYSLEKLCADTMLDAAFWGHVGSLLHDKAQIVFYGPPGTGKTWVARKFARYWVDAAEDREGLVKVIQFHPSYAYEDFIEGIRPQSVEDPAGRHALSYPVKKGLFRRLCDDAGDHPTRRYVLILDEINRGELPRIFGELLYLLEYRTESVTLPYSGESLVIPPNLFLIGTMNTADRSIALVDHALRRRFHFVRMRPNPGVLRTYFEGKGRPELAWTADLLDEVNRRLAQNGIEWHLHIGHTHFLRPDLTDSLIKLIWEHSVIPTLEEYFYRQPKQLEYYRLDALKSELGQVK